MKKIVFTLLCFIPFFGFSVVENKGYEKAIFAGGCFWCLESDFQYMQKHINH